MSPPGDDPSAGPIGNLEGDGPVRGTLVERGELVRPNAVVGSGTHREGDPGGAPALVPASRALRPSEARHQAFIAKVDRKVHKKAATILEAALRAPELADLNGEIPKKADGSWDPPPGWTKRELRVAMDATLPMKAAPAYLGMAQRTVESYHRKDSDKKEAPVLNAEIVQVTVNNQYNYPVRVVEED